MLRSGTLIEINKHQVFAFMEQMNKLRCKRCSNKNKLTFHHFRPTYTYVHKTDISQINHLTKISFFYYFCSTQFTVMSPSAIFVALLKYQLPF